jgi:hypothetical protein
MRSFVLQDWVTIKGAITTTGVIQPASDYLDLEAFEDAVVWVDVREVTTGGASSTLLLIQSAPIKEEPFFAPTNVPAPFAVLASPGVTVIPIVLNNSMVTSAFQQQPSPITRWLRWNLVQLGASSAWSVTFRVLVAAHSLSYTGS